MGTEQRQSFLSRHKPSVVVLASQLSAAVVHGVVKALENGRGLDVESRRGPIDPFQILMIRMLITGIACSIYLWYRRVPEFPLGPRDVRPLLLFRAIGGVLGAGGMYCEIFPPVAPQIKSDELINHPDVISQTLSCTSLSPKRPL